MNNEYFVGAMRALEGIPTDHPDRMSLIVKVMKNVLAVGRHEEKETEEFLWECARRSFSSLGEWLAWLEEIREDSFFLGREQSKPVIRVGAERLKDLLQHSTNDDEIDETAVVKAVMDLADIYIWSEVGEICDLMRVCGYALSEATTDLMRKELRARDILGNLSVPLKGTYKELIRALVSGKANKEGIEQTYDDHILVRDGKMVLSRKG